MSSPATAVRHPSTFVSFGEHLRAVRTAAQSRRSIVDPRLRPSAAAGAYANEGVGPDGGYAAPVDFQRQVSDLVMAGENIFPRLRRFETTKTSVTFPIDEKPAYSASGPQVTVRPEGSVLVQSKLAVGSRSLRLVKLSCLVPVSEELLEDGGNDLQAYLGSVVAERFNYLLMEHVVRGTGVEQSEGVLNANALITIAAEGGQSTGSVVMKNVQKMYGALLPGMRRSAVWLVHPNDVEQQLSSLAGQGGSVFFSYAFGEVSPRLMGIPVVPSEACSVAGTTGDILLVGCEGIGVGCRPGLVARSISHDIWFDQHLAAFRFDFRVVASVLLSAAIPQKNGSGMVSAVVALAARP
jgi:HK97 family phage major capsid protein